MDGFNSEIPEEKLVVLAAAPKSICALVTSPRIKRQRGYLNDQVSLDI
jgi:hypothetical protein